MLTGSCSVTSVFDGPAQFHDLREGKQDDGRADGQGNLSRCGVDQGMEPVFVQEIQQGHVGDHQEHHGNGFTPGALHHGFQLRLHHTDIGEFLHNGWQRILHGTVRLALDQDIGPLVEYPVGYLHLQRVDGAGHVGVDQLALIYKCLEVGFYWFVDVRQVLPYGAQQVLRPQVGRGDDGDGGLQLLVQMFLIAGRRAAQIPYGHQGKAQA